MTLTTERNIKLFQGTKLSGYLMGIILCTWRWYLILILMSLKIGETRVRKSWWKEYQVSLAADVSGYNLLDWIIFVSVRYWNCIYATVIMYLKGKLLWGTAVTFRLFALKSVGKLVWTPCQTVWLYNNLNVPFLPLQVHLSPNLSFTFSFLTLHFGCFLFPVMQVVFPGEKIRDMTSLASNAVLILGQGNFLLLQSKFLQICCWCMWKNRLLLPSTRGFMVQTIIVCVLKIMLLMELPMPVILSCKYPGPLIKLKLLLLFWNRNN